MKISDIFLLNFRNIQELNINLPEKVILNGKNGSGKTSIIEACYILLCGKSFRSSDIKECIQKGKKNFYIKCLVEDFELFNREISIGFDESGSRKIIIDGVYSSRKELMNIVYPVIHTPDDMELVKGGPKRRRDFVDRVCFMEDKKYYDSMLEYYRFVKQKNIALKKKSIKTVSYLNSAAIPLISEIREKRRIVCNKLNEKIKKILDQMFPEYKISFNCQNDENIAEKLSLKLEKELIKGFTIYGPHLDPLNLVTETGNVKNNISMGETYVISFLMKLTEISLYADRQIYPVFFIDDLFVFLDEDIKDKLLTKILFLKNQIIMTSSTEKHFKSENIKYLDLDNI